MHHDFQNFVRLINQIVHHFAQLIHEKFDIFVSNLIFHSFHVIRERVDVMNFHVVCSTIEYSFHRFLTTSIHASFDRSNDVIHQIRRFIRRETRTKKTFLKFQLNDHESSHFDDVKHEK